MAHASVDAAVDKVGSMLAEEGEALEEEATGRATRKARSSGQRQAIWHNAAEAMIRSARRAFEKPACESDEPKSDRQAAEMVPESSIPLSVLLGGSHESQPTSSPPAYPTPTESPAQETAESELSSPSLLVASSPVSEQASTSRVVLHSKHRGYIEAQDRTSLVARSGVRSCRKNDPTSLKLREQSATIKMQSLEMRAIRAEQQIVTLHETVRANDAEAKVRVFEAELAAFKAVEAVRAEGREQAMQGKLLAEKEALEARLMADAAVRATVEKVEVLSLRAARLAQDLKETKDSLDETLSKLLLAEGPAAEIEQAKPKAEQQTAHLATIEVQLANTQAELEKAKQETASAYGKRALAYGQRKGMAMCEKIALDFGMRKMGQAWTAKPTLPF